MPTNLLLYINYKGGHVFCSPLLIFDIFFRHKILKLKNSIAWNILSDFSSNIVCFLFRPCIDIQEAVCDLKFRPPPGDMYRINR